jgi:hypothetical protein
MSIRTILAAAFVAGSIASPALANDGPTRSTTPSNVIEFYSSGQSQRLVEGRNSDRGASVTNRTQAATSQGFAPIDTNATARGANN